jgi:hypothetical protein
MNKCYELLLYLFTQDCINNSIDFDEEEIDDYILETWLYDKFEINIESFEDLMQILLPLCIRAESGMTGEVHSGFGNNGFWLLKDND